MKTAFVAPIRQGICRQPAATICKLSSRAYTFAFRAQPASSPHTKPTARNQILTHVPRMLYDVRTSACWTYGRRTHVGFLDKFTGGKKGVTIKKGVASPALKKAAPKKAAPSKKSSATKKTTGKKK